MIISTPLFDEELLEKGATSGHIRFTLKSRKPEDIALVGFCANVASSLLFERMQAQGSNIIMNLTREGGTIDVLARRENDGLDLLWTPKDPGAINEVQERIKNKTFMIGKDRGAQKSVEQQDNVIIGQSTNGNKIHAKVTIEKTEGLSEEEEDYLVKQLHRIP